MRAAQSCPRWALLALALPLALPAERLSLLPHGEERGDAALEPGDDARSAALELSTALRFYGAAVRSLYVSVGGREGAGTRSGWRRVGKAVGGSPGGLSPLAALLPGFGLVRGGACWVSSRLRERRGQRSVQRA